MKLLILINHDDKDVRHRKKRKSQFKKNILVMKRKRIVLHQQDVYRVKNDVVVMILHLMMTMIMKKQYINVDYFIMEKLYTAKASQVI